MAVEVAGPTSDVADTPARTSADMLPSAGNATAPVAFAPVVVRLNTTFDHYTGVWDAGVQGTHSAEWDAAADLALPRPMGSLLFEMRCQRTAGEAFDDPGYFLAFDVLREDGNTIMTSAAGNLGDCKETKRFDRADSYAPSGKLVRAQFGAQASLLSVDASYDVRFAISWFPADKAPDGFSAFA